MKTAILSITLLALPIASTHAANLFVRHDGYGNECNAAVPCGSLQAAINRAGPKDRIHVSAGTYTENITIPAGKDGLQIRGDDAEDTLLISAGGDNPPKFAPAGVPVDIIVDIFSANVTIEELTIRHPAGIPTKRDIGIFVRPTAINASIEKNSIERLRTGAVLEPTNPGSRGVFVIRATGTEITKNRFSGNYEDHVHLPTSGSEVVKNKISGALRLGIVVIQETPDTLSRDNVITNNTVRDSGSDGIQIEGDANTVSRNKVTGSGGAGIRLCGPTSQPACAAPGMSATSGDNIVTDNKLSGNAGGTIVDDGVGNTIRSSKVRAERN